MNYTKCPDCGSECITKNGHRRGKQQLCCKNPDCKRSQFSLPPNEVNLNPNNNRNSFTNKNFKEEESTTYEQGDNFINIICASKRMLTKDEVIKQFKIDLNEWKIESFKVKTSEGYRKDRKVEWDVSDGTVTHGHVRDSGKMLIVPLYHIEVRLKRKVEEIRLNLIKEDIIRDIKKHTFKYPKITYPALDDKCLLEVDLFDLHFGKLTWAEETGDNYDIKIAERLFMKCINDIIVKAEGYHIDRVLFPVGNDFFNVDNKENSTAKGTPQQEDTRWKKTFRKGRQLIVKAIDILSTIAPVDVIIVPGNHDYERAFYLGDSLEAWYHKCANVRVNNNANTRKYYAYGNVLLGFAHGKTEKPGDLRALMPVESPELWAKSKFREWHLGDQHRKIEYFHKGTEEHLGITIRFLRSLTATDSYHHEHVFKAHIRAAEAFIWNKELGMVCQYYVNLKRK